MNKRIKELMKQADYPAPEIALRAQNLVELVVRECADIAKKAEPFQTYDLILKNFGLFEERK